VVEEADKGTDTLDFKAVTHDLTFDIKPNGTGDGKGIQVSPTIDGNAVVGTGFAPRIQHVEVLVGGTGTNKYNFGKDWAKSLLIDNQASSSGTLDFSRVGPGVDLTFVVENADPGFLSKFTGVGFPVALNKITVTDGNKHKAIAYNIHNLIGGQGNNTYEFKDGAVLPGKLTGGPAGQAADKSNILDYSAYGQSGASSIFGFGGEPVFVNTDGVAHTLTTQAVSETVTHGVAPVKEAVS